MTPDAVVPHWVVWSFEHAGWWGPGWRGYTPELSEAGHYTELEALRIEHDANIVAFNERALPLADAEQDGPPPPHRQAG